MKSTNTSMIGVRTSDTPQERLRYLHDTLSLSWREIANLDEYRGIPAGSLCSYAKGELPKGRHRAQLGLPPLGHVIVMFGVVPDGSQVLMAERCECGQWFISNHPARRRCFICSPFRRRR